MMHKDPEILRIIGTIYLKKIDDALRKHGRLKKVYLLCVQITC
jgi:hypothetical protein